MVDSLRLFAAEVTRVAKEVGTDGQLGGQAYVYVFSPARHSREIDSFLRLYSINVSGEWKSLVDSVNQMCGNLTDQVRSIAKATVRLFSRFCTLIRIPTNLDVVARLPSLEEICRKKSRSKRMVKFCNWSLRSILWLTE